MRPNTAAQTAHIDHGVSREITMTMSSDAADAAHVLATLTNLYSDKEVAFIREIATNAWDSHDAAGQTRPIEVTLPTSSRPNFIVQDWGVGLSADELESIYALYGRSTKRESDTATGTLGLGCKAPLTYCLSFTVEAVKDGIKVIAVVAKNDMGVGTIKVLSEDETDESNGVKITVPISNVHSVQDKAETFFQYWRSGVLVDGEDPEPLPSETWIDPDIAVLPRGTQSKIVMGNVAYPFSMGDGLPSVVAWVPMGAVNFTPAREALHQTDLTNDTISTIESYVKDAMDRTITREVEATRNSWERRQVISRLKKELPLRYQHPMLNQRDLVIPSGGDEKVAWVVRHGERSAETYLNDAFLNGHYQFVTNFPFKRVANLHLDMLRAAGISQPYIVLPTGCGFSTDGFPGISWDKVPRLPKAKRVRSEEPAPPRTETRYDIWVDGRCQILTHYEGDFDVTWVVSNPSRAREISAEFGYAVGNIISTQVDRFCRLHPGATPWDELVSTHVRRSAQYLTKEDRRYLRSTQWERTLSRVFGDAAKRVKDKKLRQHMNLTTSDHLNRLFRIAEVISKAYVMNHLSNADDAALLDRGPGFTPGWDERRPERRNNGEYLVENYPLLSQMWAPSEDMVDDLVLYLNAKYREIKKRETFTQPEQKDVA